MGDFFSFCKFLFNDCYTVFSIFKKDPEKAGGGVSVGRTGKHTVGTESGTQMFCVSRIFRDICLCMRLAKVKLSSTRSPK